MLCVSPLGEDCMWNSYPATSHHEYNIISVESGSHTVHNALFFLKCGLNQHSSSVVIFQTISYSHACTVTGACLCKPLELHLLWVAMLQSWTMLVPKEEVVSLLFTLLEEQLYNTAHTVLLMYMFVCPSSSLRRHTIHHQWEVWSMQNW